jgi:hypothetical protein
MRNSVKHWRMYSQRCEQEKCMASPLAGAMNLQISSTPPGDSQPWRRPRCTAKQPCCAAPELFRLKVATCGAWAWTGTDVDLPARHRILRDARLLDEAALAAIDKAAPFPPMPHDVAQGPLEVQVPFQFVAH